MGLKQFLIIDYMDHHLYYTAEGTDLRDAIRRQLDTDVTGFCFGFSPESFIEEDLERDSDDRIDRFILTKGQKEHIVDQITKEVFNYDYLVLDITNPRQIINLSDD